MSAKVFDLALDVINEIEQWTIPIRAYQKSRPTTIRYQIDYSAHIGRDRFERLRHLQHV